MAKSNAKKSGGAKKKPAAKKTAPKKAAPKKEETPVAPPVEEPQVDADIPTGPGNPEPKDDTPTPPEEMTTHTEGINEGSGDVPATEPADDLTTTETDEPEGETQGDPETVVEEPAAHPDPDPEPEENVKPAPVAEDTSWRDRVVIEAKELKEKMVALRSAIDERKVPLDQVPILNEQYTAMHAYYLILNRRLSQ